MEEETLTTIRKNFDDIDNELCDDPDVCFRIAMDEILYFRAFIELYPERDYIYPVVFNHRHMIPHYLGLDENIQNSHNLDIDMKLSLWNLLDKQSDDGISKEEFLVSKLNLLDDIRIRAQNLQELDESFRKTLFQPYSDLLKNIPTLIKTMIKDEINNYKNDNMHGSS